MLNCFHRTIVRFALLFFILILALPLISCDNSDKISGIVLSGDQPV